MGSCLVPYFTENAFSVFATLVILLRGVLLLFVFFLSKMVVEFYEMPFNICEIII